MRAAISSGSDELFSAGHNCCSDLMLKYSSWSDRQIVISGFGTGYGENGWAVLKGDPIIVAIWNANYLNGPAAAPQAAAASVLP